ncbi:hypothetical protein [Pelagibaculum spongiae]|uniref:hypothetical protein n=1 Tax=Pelagibaculum spongiae TaxID=2080658 RepID=UPI001F4D80CC|nr:hypothetical protein [Pelagibaculum spongiae]
MAFDYGSIDLGLKNPFKKEGWAVVVRGTLISCLALFLLVKAAAIVKGNAGVGWILAVFGVLLLSNGISSLASGIMALLRYFVGRNHPTSLAKNFSRSESSTAQEEAQHVAYSRQTLIEMLVGRKNATFIEPRGFLTRFVHTLFPRLTYMPYPIRNLAQMVFSTWIKTITALVAYALVAFVSLAGFAGQLGTIAFPAYSVVLVLYLLTTWRSVANRAENTAQATISSLGKKDLVKLISGAFIFPILISFGLSAIVQRIGLTTSELNELIALLPNSYAFVYIISILIFSALATGIISFLLRSRLQHTDPKVEVSELRENWQESVHPNEIFINLDNLVMANRRFKEVPNRVYQELEPKLQEQTEGKGSFFGEIIQEVQPKFREMKFGKTFNIVRLVSLAAGNAMLVIAALLTTLLAFQVGDLYQFASLLKTASLSINNIDLLTRFSAELEPVIHLILFGFLIKSIAKLLSNTAHIFFAEMQFESSLIYFKCEGTFTESTISTGSGIYDSTRSENTLVRSSITPWIIVTKVISSTFASTGMKNLEHPRFILEMHKDDTELASIRRDVVSFLKDRESIASITSERDLGNAAQIYEINQQSRAAPVQQEKLANHDVEAAARIQQEAPEPST